MNGLIPALLAVLLAEVGPRGAALAFESGRTAIVFLVATIVAAAAVAGALLAPRLAPNAETLLIALALAFGGWAQASRVAPPATTRAALLAFWRGGTALLVFALATRFAPLSVGVGAAGGLGAAAVLGRLVDERAMRLVRRACVLVLLVAGAILAVVALRLV